MFSLVLFGVLMLIGRLPIQRLFVCRDCRSDARSFRENLSKFGTYTVVVTARANRECTNTRSASRLPRVETSRSLTNFLPLPRQSVLLHRKWRKYFAYIKRNAFIESSFSRAYITFADLTYKRMKKPRKIRAAILIKSSSAEAHAAYTRTFG